MPKSNGKYVRIAIEIVIVLFAVAAAWATLREDVKQNSKDLTNQDTRIAAVEKSLPEIKSDIRVILTEQRHIREGIDEIKEKVK